MPFLVYCTDEYHHVSDSTLNTLFPYNEYNNEPIYESVKMFVVSNVNNAEQAKDIIFQETNLQAIKVEEINHD